MSDEYIIERLGHLGEGIAAGPVFVPNALPGETVTGTRTGTRLSNVKILVPSVDRVRPPCPHFKTCGGCSLQHASDRLLKSWKTDVVLRALSAQGLNAPTDIVSSSPTNSRRRATLSGTRTKKGTRVGFHERGSGLIVEIPDCRILHPSLLATLPALGHLTRLSASRKGEVSFTLTVSLTGIDLLITTQMPLDPATETTLGTFAAKHGFARICWNETIIVQIDAPSHLMATAKVSPPPGAFLQATLQGQDALVRSVCNAISGANKVADLFAGCGTFSFPVAEFAEVLAVEGSAAMLQSMDTGWRHSTALHRITTQDRDLFRRPLLVDELNRFDAIVIDPPRAGADAQFREIAKSNVHAVAAVSCNPISFARDVKHLVQAGFTIDKVDIVDQFRWTPHIELVASCSR